MSDLTYTEILRDSNTRAVEMDEGATRPTGWAKRHMSAWNAPQRANEAAVVNIIKALAWYADAHQSTYESDIGDDGVLGEGWASMLKGARTLLNGDCGRLDCGTLDRMLCEMAVKAGVDI